MNRRSPHTFGLLLLAAALCSLCACTAPAPRAAVYAAPDAGRVAAPLKRTGGAIERAKGRTAKVLAAPSLALEVRQEVAAVQTDLEEATAARTEAENELSALDKQNQAQISTLNATVGQRDKLQNAYDSEVSARKNAQADADEWRKRYRKEFGFWARLKSHFWTATIAFGLGVAALLCLRFFAWGGRLLGGVGLRATTGL